MADELDLTANAFTGNARDEGFEAVTNVHRHAGTPGDAPPPRVVLGPRDDEWWVHTRAGVVALRLLPRLAAPQPSAEAGGSLRAPMPGVVLQVLVEVGQRVSKGQPLMKLEAMKMEHTIRGAADGIVETIHYAPGEQVAAGAQLLRIR